jgi:hypothetical protein
MTPAWKLIDSYASAVLSARNSIAEHGGVVLYVEDGKVKVDIIKWGIEHIEEIAL